ncbi:hypothetical protein LTR56_006508 [Elasticomyces elasticus]|nr:hypothetical protein LTR22_022067 [Elasticomyces elasticus]KAK3649921.1 hypothetical protein LTR56_006508 [Elasticomyces elasticus]KAK4931675.1 hypothetical protein LTR49_001740 [Elasticomyces elasticus]KAK5740720.1 hypothetical protein LTS12_024850 [Elasticomyces elasticus]
MALGGVSNVEDITALAHDITLRPRLPMDASLRQQTIDELKGDVEQMEADLEKILDQLQDVQERLIAFADSIQDQHEWIDNLRKKYAGILSSDTIPEMDEELKREVEDLQDTLGFLDTGSTIKQIRNHMPEILQKEEAELAQTEVDYAQQNARQLEMLLDMNRARKKLDYAKELLGGKPATYQTNAPGDELLPLAWRS